MKEQEARSQVLQAGRQLLEQGLVARTWGNVSCKVDEEHFIITPSGLSYQQTQAEDLVLYDRRNEQWEGGRKPSSEKRIHSCAYEIFPDTGFVIHTHQTYASALGISGAMSMDITEEERQRLGGIAVASYGLPGTKKLQKAVFEAMKTGAHTIFLIHHGVVICGKDQEDAYEKAALLEEICRRNCWGQVPENIKGSEKALREVQEQLSGFNSGRKIIRSAPVLQVANSGALVAQLDDMAQMMGRRVPAVSVKEAVSILRDHPAVLIPEVGAVVHGQDEEDTQALALLMEKSCICALHTRARGEEKFLSRFDCSLMHFIYQKKYSKKKNR